MQDTDDAFIDDAFTPEGRELLKETWKPYITEERQKEVREFTEEIRRLARKHVEEAKLKE